MSFCDNCARSVWDKPELPFPPECIECQDIVGKPSHFLPKRMSNADRIRAMSDEELAEDFCKTVLGVMEQLGIENTGSVEDAVRVRLEWLKQPAEVDNG